MANQSSVQCQPLDVDYLLHTSGVMRSLAPKVFASLLTDGMDEESVFRYVVREVLRQVFFHHYAGNVSVLKC